MITRLKSMGIYVKDQNEALEFYTQKVGFELNSDVTQGGYRWLAVSPKGQPELQFSLSALKPGGNLTEEGVEMLTNLLDTGQLQGGIWETDDCRKTYEEMAGNGVEFMQEPVDMPWGVQALWKDNSGNWFTLIEPKY